MKYIIEVFVIAIAVFFAGVIWGASVATRALRTEAVKAGAACWIANPDGSTTFKWK